MEVFISPKIPKKFNCEFCDYHTSNKKDYIKHLTTRKHKKCTNGNFGSIMEIPKIPKPQTFICECERNFATHSGYWKHKQKCKLLPTNNDIIDISNVKLITNLVLEVVKQNTESQKQNQDLINKLYEICKNGTTHNTTNNNNNSHNKSFNLQFFLNETCKNAMNITDFVDSLQLQLSDLERVGELGYVEGISNIIIKNLNALDVSERPIHCTDKKRETMYIKDEDKWEKEDENKIKMHKMVKKIANKNIHLITEFREKYPEYKKCKSNISDKFNKIIIESMGGNGDNEYEKEEKIIKKVAKEVFVDK
jgi:hypothetical protein